MVIIMKQINVSIILLGLSLSLSPLATAAIIYSFSRNPEYNTALLSVVLVYEVSKFVYSTCLLFLFPLTYAFFFACTLLLVTTVFFPPQFCICVFDLFFFNILFIYLKSRVIDGEVLHLLIRSLNDSRAEPVPNQDQELFPVLLCGCRGASIGLFLLLSKTH